MSKLKFAAVLLSIFALSPKVFSQEPCSGGNFDRKPFGPRIQRMIDGSFADSEPIMARCQKTVDLTQFLVPDLKYSDPLQYHFSGYGRCFRNTPDCRDENGTPILRDGGFAKIAQAENSPEGDTRFIFQKDRRHPNEYYIVKNELGSDGEPVQIVYIETETMDWPWNQYARTYHREDGYPSFEWGRSNAVVGGLNLQYWIRGKWIFCGAKPDEYELQGSTPSGYVPRVYDLSKDIEAINRDLAELGPIEPKWLDMAKDTGKDPQLLVYAGYWSPVSQAVGNAPSLWWNRELYFYVKGLGFVGWRWQEHVDGDRFKPFQTLQEGIASAVVWEDEPILPLAVCEKVPQ
ncbi:MAG: hypothetical protein Q7S36_03010 [Candidatus Liptonbacteria bacterium]|nr:hypothetical protein [Candidatus Liptonbacteria bacterium]